MKSEGTRDLDGKRSTLVLQRWTCGQVIVICSVSCQDFRLLKPSPFLNNRMAGKECPLNT